IVRLARTMQTMEGRHDLQTMRTVPAVGVPIEEVEQLTSDFRQLMLRIDSLIDEDISKQVLLADMRYKSLQQQINPHFLYNTLETVNWKAIEHGETEISVIVRSLSGLLRSAIGGPDTITVAEDLRIAEDYITIQKIRFEERLDYVADVPAEALRGVIPHLTIQPIVENCVTHNLEKNAGVCRIRLAARIEKGQLCIVVEDNGKGIDPDHVRRVLSGQVPTSESGIGLKNIDERIKLIFGEDYGIVVENRLDEAGGILGTRVCISLPSPPRWERDFTTPAGPAGGIS
ncbi:MAG TPA: sensor histidine kinase, partial [Clostridia bacterium]